ncbi:MAG: DUF2149 domain-containing protein [Coriobacteriales bacterium]|jgi:hypothetical protein
MIRRSRRSLNRGNPQNEEDVNPNSYVTNLADCMLVLAVGLLVALVSNYGLDLTSQTQQQEQVTGIEVNMDEDQDGQIDDSYEQAGTVYYDETTGKYYMVQN